MTPPLEHSTTAARPVAMRASVIGAVLTAVAVTVVWSVASAEAIPESARPYLLVGALAGALAGTLGNTIVARGALRRIGGAQASSDFVRAIVMDFALQVFAVIGVTLVLRFLLALKFPEFATLGFTLAGAVAFFRVPGTILVSRALESRARETGDAATAAPAAQDSN